MAAFLAHKGRRFLTWLLHLLSHIKILSQLKIFITVSCKFRIFDRFIPFLESPCKSQRDENERLAKRFGLIYILRYDFGLSSLSLSLSPCLCFYSHPRAFFFIAFRERRRERGEREKLWCKREALIGCLPHVTWPRIRDGGSRIESVILACALTGNQTHNLLFMGRCSDHLSHMGQGWSTLLCK